MALDDVNQLVVSGVVSGQQHIHTLHLRHLNGSTTDQMVIDQWQAGCRTAYRALFVDIDSPCVSYKSAQVCGAGALRAPTEETETGPLSLGSRGSSVNRMPPWTAAVFSERTALAGARRRGRFFIGGLQEGDQQLGMVEDSYRDIMIGYITALMGTFGPAGSSLDLALVVWSPTLRALVGSTCLGSATAVTGILWRRVLGSMRSRHPSSGG